MVTRLFSLAFAFASAAPALATEAKTLTDGRVQFGSAVYRFDDRAFADDFKSTLIFGHSVSADFLRGVVSLANGPGTVLARAYAGAEPVGNVSEPRDFSALQWDGGVVLNFPSGLDKMQQWIEGSDEQMNSLYEKSKVIIGVDALYLAPTTLFNVCDEDYVDYVMDEFTYKAFSDGKITILGNVPKEDREQMSWTMKIAVAPQIESCRQMLNRKLKTYCRAGDPDRGGRNCYIVDFEDIVMRLNRDGQLVLNDGTVLYRDRKIQMDRTGKLTWEPSLIVRPDTVNLGDRGMQVIVEAILKAMKKSPPVRAGAQSGLAPN